MLLSVLAVLALALSPVDAYNQGNRLYAQKDYARAAQSYEQALAAGPNARVLYNLGNALFKSGSVGRAILAYRRARYLAPRDADVRANLAFARAYRVDKLLAAPSPLAALLDDLGHRLSHREATLGAAVAFALAALALAGWIVRRWDALLALAVAGAIAALACLVCQQTWAAEVDSRPAVVVVAEASAASGPTDDAKEILQVHDGTEVRIRETRGDWLLVQVPGGAGGWLRKGAVERVY